MIKNQSIFVFLIYFIIPVLAFSQSEKLLIKPYLQDATPNSIKIKWESSKGKESVVEYGKSN
ncbi:MAG: metallophosphoesterase, partial [Flammeovirgaceae bacterium]|nr:metallophosphoesterase [Flammeovirgaceae bacterium]